MRWDIFCRVIDNHGDLGVCWRLACDLSGRGHAVRLWVDEPAALAWMAPERPAAIELIHWRQAPSAQGAIRLATGQPLADPRPGDVIVEAFGCEIDPAFAAQLPAQLPAKQPAQLATPSHGAPARRWINLEYLSAESYVERSHGLPSPVMSGPAAGQTKFFFYPGLSARTGGLLREPDLRTRQAAFDATGWLAGHGIVRQPGERLLSLFCYEPAVLPRWLRALSQRGGDAPPVRLLVTPGRAQAAVDASGEASRAQGWQAHSLPYLAQPQFDALLWSCDINFVRGEDSLVRALWAGRPFVWHIYPQHDGAHIPKLEAFLDLWLHGAPPRVAQAVRHWHRWWNGAPPGHSDADADEAEGQADHDGDQDGRGESPRSRGEGGAPAPLPPGDLLADWHDWARRARDRLWLQDDLASQLIRFLGQNG